MKAFLSSAKKEQLCDTASAFLVIKAPVAYELCSWLQNWQTKTLSNWCKGKALPMLRARKLSSSCLQNTAMAQSTYIIYYSRLFSEKLWRKSQKRWWRHDSNPLMTPQISMDYEFLLDLFYYRSLSSAWSLEDRQQADRRLKSEMAQLSSIHITGVNSQHTSPHGNIAINSIGAWSSSSSFQFLKSVWAK